MPSEPLIIALPFSRKAFVDRDTYQAALRALRIYSNDSRVGAYAGLPDTEVIAAIRKRAIARGELPKNSYSRTRKDAG